MERSMNEENEWNHNVEGDVVGGPVSCIVKRCGGRGVKGNENLRSPRTFRCIIVVGCC